MSIDVGFDTKFVKGVVIVDGEEMPTLEFINRLAHIINNQYDIIEFAIQAYQYRKLQQTSTDSLAIEQAENAFLSYPLTEASLEFFDGD